DTPRFQRVEIFHALRTVPLAAAQVELDAELVALVVRVEKAAFVLRHLETDMLRIRRVRLGGKHKFAFLETLADTLCVEFHFQGSNYFHDMLILLITNKEKMARCDTGRLQTNFALYSVFGAVVAN